MSSTTANWQFSLDVVPGMHDLFAYNDARVVLRRDLAVTTASSQPTIDLAAGSALTSVPFTVTGAGTDTVGSEYELLTGNDYAFWTGTASSVKTVPASLVTTNDFAFLVITASGSSTFRYADETYDSTAGTTFDLLPKLTGIQLTDHSATWSSIPQGSASLHIYSNTAVTSNANVNATESWLGTKTSLDLDLAIPGYDPAWKPDLSAYNRSFQVAVDVGPVSLSSSYDETIGAVARRAPHLARVRQLNGESRKIVP